SQLSYSAGSTLNWQGEHNGMSISFVQRLSDSGLSGGGAVSARTASLQMQHRITKESTISLTGNYVSNGQVDPLSVVPLANSASAGVTFTKVLTPRLSINFSALRQQFIGNAP